MNVLNTNFKEYMNENAEDLNEGFYGDVQMFFYKNNKRYGGTSKEILEFLSDDGQDEFKSNGNAFFKLMTKCAKNRNKMMDFVDKYFAFDDEFAPDDLETMNGKWFGFEPIDKMKPLYCMPLQSKGMVFVVFAMNIE